MVSDTTVHSNGDGAFATRTLKGASAHADDAPPESTISTKLELSSAMRWARLAQPEWASFSLSQRFSALERAAKAMLITPGDEDCRSAGSFFKNPIVSSAEADRVESLAQQRVPGKKLPRYPVEAGPMKEEQVKLSAAWLVEQAGFSKGYSRGSVGISRKHTLAIVNRGGATASDIMALKDEVQKKVFDVWGVQLHPEPVFVGFDPP